MRLLKPVFDFYLDASIHVALAVVCLNLHTSLGFNKTPNYFLVGFLFFGTIVCYNFMKYGVEAKKYLIVHKPYHKIIQVFSFLCFPFAVYCFLQLSRELWFPIALLTILSGLYILPFLPTSKSLRTLGGFKIFLVALVWVGFTVLLPAIEYQLQFGLVLYLNMLKRFLLVIILFIPFEIRDLKVDSIELKTLPQRIGTEKTKKVGYGLVILYFLITVYLDHSLSNFIIALILFAVLGVAIKYTTINQSKYYAAFWIEGIPIFLLIITGIALSLI
ncbi:hypothetical protein [Croceivirga thetidis]|uniref:Prenyltransferase n=1 Tax=Croceivirga thetidis TaxID=2721623 RepID=A0ABX1GUD6_9FLAO|nr:hypothetical protein [Croceivirga thetidis]NKI33273.1 hypothetical protein [Croceivirga thetidis]